MIASLSRRPTAVLSALAGLALLVTVAVGAGLTLLPGASVSVVQIDADRFRVSEVETVDADAMLRLVDAQGRERARLPAWQLTTQIEPGGTAAEAAEVLRMRSQVAEAMHEQGMRLVLPSGRSLPAHLVPHPFGKLAASAALVLLVGLLATLTGCWVLVMRPREWAAQMFALSAFALQVATFTIASIEQRSLIVPPGYERLETEINYWCGFLFGFALMAMFLRYPRKLVGKRFVAGFAALLAAERVLAMAGAWRDSPRVESGIVVVLGLGIVALTALQGWLSRRDPGMRAVFAWIGSAVVLCLTPFLLLTMAPQIMGRPPIVPLPITAAGFLLFYGALGIGVARYRLFDLGSWTVHALRIAGLLTIIFAIDATIAIVLHEQWSLSLAFLGTAIAWLPLRELLLRRAERTRATRDTGLLRSAGAVAFALDRERQQAAWKALLAEQFLPLSVDETVAARTELRDDGSMLAVPSPIGQAGLLLRHAGRGARLFNGEDVALAEALRAIVSEMVEARTAYDRGVEAERRRIARDLHDDIGARLMTTLHRDDLATVQADVREAMADMRVIIDGMSGQTRRLCDLLADLRHETVERCRLARLSVEWPIGDVFDDERPVDAHCVRVLYSAVRELVSNIIRHAGAAQVLLILECDGDVLALEVRDDGRGIDATKGANSGNGLGNLRKRVEDRGGTTAIVSGPGGTCVTIALPLRSPERGMVARVPAL